MSSVKVYTFPRAQGTPSLSPFALKLETFLRMAKIDYECDHSSKFSKKGKIPWILHDGEAVADSSFCIAYLEKKLNRFLDADLSEKDKGTSRAFIKMTEENTVWATLAQGRMVENFPWMLNQIQVPKALQFVARLTFRRKIINNMWAQGIGRHTPEEIRSIAEGDLRSCSQFLGTKPYFMGENATLIDATMFGFLAQLLYSMPEGHWTTALINNNFTNLREYCERMKNEFWPDWNDLLTVKKD